MSSTFSDLFSRMVFAKSGLWLSMLFLISAGFFIACFSLRIDAGFAKNLPMNHPFMKTYHEHAEEFGGANKLLLVVQAKNGNALTKEVMVATDELSKDLEGVTGINAGRITSIFSPNTYFLENGNVNPVVPREEFNFSESDLETVRQNCIKAGVVGRLVSRDFSCLLIQGSLSALDPATGEELNYRAVGGEIEALRERTMASAPVDVHAVGFAMGIKSVADGATGVILFFLIAIVITIILVWFFTRSLWLTLVPVFCSLVAVVWNLGLITLLGYGLDPMSLLVPFLIFAIGVSHGVQMVNAIGIRLREGVERKEACRQSFRTLIVPGIVALISDTIGFAAIWLIPIPTIRELAILASIGVMVIVITNLFMLPLLLSIIGPRRLGSPSISLGNTLLIFTRSTPARIAAGVAALLAVGGCWQAKDLPIGDLKPGVPELRQSAQLNQDIAVLNEKFDIGTDVLNILAISTNDAVIIPEVAFAVDEFTWELENVEGVQGAVNLQKVMKLHLSSQMDNSVKWQSLFNDRDLLSMAQQYIETSLGLHSGNGDIMNIMVFLEDHKAETIERIIAKARELAAQHEAEYKGETPLRFELALGNMGVMAATNEVVDAAQFRIMLYVYAVIIALCLLMFRSVRATLCIVLPLLVVSLLGYAMMRWLDIGLKISTLPVVALGAGIGVDYGIYILSSLRRHWVDGGDGVDGPDGVSLVDAYRKTLSETGVAVLVTGLTLALGVSTWMFSALKFQADMGLVLAFLFFGNMIGALVLLPALARIFHPERA